MTLRGWAAGAAMALAAGSTVGAQAVISGRITSSLGEPLAAANVVIAELNRAVATTADGRYSITIPAEQLHGQSVLLRARAIGFKPEQRRVSPTADAQTADFILAVDINRLEEVVITGVTGATAQRNLPFTVAKVDASGLQVPAVDPLSQLAGKVAGAQITSYSGRPGTQAAVLLRGPKSINGTDRGQSPLFIVDGVMVNGALPDLNTQDIESVEVVKGAAASSLYGSRAGNGVIQITTKRGAGLGGSERAQFAARTEYGQGAIPGAFQLAQRQLLMMDETGKRFCVHLTAPNIDCAQTVDLNEEALRINQQAIGALILTPVSFVQDYSLNGAATVQQTRGLFQVNPWPTQHDAIAAATTNGAFATQNAELTGRSGGTNYFASASNLIQAAPFVSLDGFRRQSFRLNLDNQASERWRVALTTFYSANRSDAANIDGSAGSSFFFLTRVPAGVDLTTRDQLGRLLVRSNPLGAGVQNVNPLYDFAFDRQTNQGDRAIGTLDASYTPAPGVVLDGKVGVDRLGTGYLKIKDRGFRATGQTAIDTLGNIERYDESQRAYNASLNANVAREFGNGFDSHWTTQFLYERQNIATDDQSGPDLVVGGLTNTQAARQNIAIRSSDQTVSSIGMLTGVGLTYRDRYIVDGLFRRDGSSLFGADARWANYGRGSVAWRLTQEPWWFVPALSELKLRASLGTAGGRPKFDAQYESFNLGAGGLLTANTIGNKELRPEVTTELEFGVDAELLRRIGLSVTYAHDVTGDQILLVPPPAATGFTAQWRNAGTLDNKTWEVSLNLPVVTRRDFTWSSRINYDRNRTVITALATAPYSTCAGTPCVQGTTSMFLMQNGEQLGTIYGDRFVRSCGELSPTFASQCGPGKEWQKNNDGYVVWVGQGNTFADGITRNLWQSERFGCVTAAGAKINVIGRQACTTQGGIVNTPNGVTNPWGNLIILRDSTGSSVPAAIGHTLPDYRVSFAQFLTWRRLSAYGLLDASIGNDVWNEARHWSLGDLQTREEDQDGKTVEAAKPLSYYWRGGPPESAGGSYGAYNTLRPSNFTTEDASYAKIREVSLSYNVGAVRGLGDWTVSAVGRNLYTFTHYKGFDPEVGRAGGQLGSGALNGVDAFMYPNIRTLTISLGSRF